MNPPESDWISLHEDAAFFKAAVTFTSRETGFSPRLVEKDYFCSALLALLARLGDTVFFKGGTCLAKVHAGFYRLSEDLDFVIPSGPYLHPFRTPKSCGAL
jgi:predicted nucleotidyltransferase component of viral defense system